MTRALAGLNQSVSVPLKAAPETGRQKWRKHVNDMTTVQPLLTGNPVWSLRVWRACSIFQQPSGNSQIRMFLNCVRFEALARHHSGKATDSGVVIFDQGIYQAIWSLALRAPMHILDDLSRNAQPLLKLIRVPDLVVLVDTPADVVRDRLFAEPAGHGRLPSLIKQDPHWLTKAEQSLNSVWQLARQGPPPRTYRVTSTQSEVGDLVKLLVEGD